MSDNPPHNPGDASGGYQSPPPPAYAAPDYPPAQQPYGAAAQYPDAGAYAAAPYPYAQQKTNTLAVVSLVASLVGIVGILPFIGSLVGVITGHMSLNQLKTNGEKGRGMALAGTIIGWVGLGLAILGGILLVFLFIGLAASENTRYGT